MIDLNDIHSRIRTVDQEDRALQRCNPSAWSMPEDEQEHILKNMLLSSSSSFGSKAINLLGWCSAPTKVKHTRITIPVGHMSVLYIRVQKLLVHADLQMATRYIQVVSEQTDRVVENSRIYVCQINNIVQ
jgi:hypothetical protein